MSTRYSPSVNIIRDTGKDLRYIPTPNSVRAMQQIGSDYKKGTRAFNIIGSYGTGKSSFLWAFREVIEGRKKFFRTQIVEAPRVQFINVVGEYRSLQDALAEVLEVKGKRQLSDAIFEEVYNKYHELGRKNPLLVLVIDEFGKFLEFAAQNNPERELFFIQQLAEFVNNPDINILLLTTVHQNFDAYALGLTMAQKQEWTKVKGRFREIAFNEPVDQLLFLAAEFLKGQAPNTKAGQELKRIATLLSKNKIFGINADFLDSITGNLYPLELLSACTLTLALQRYGQNERSLFSFLESTDQAGLNAFAQKHPGRLFGLPEVYDYLLHNYFPFINSRYNPDFAAWGTIRSSIEKVEATFDGQAEDACKLVKTIGLLAMLAQAGAIIDMAFLTSYAEKALAINGAEALIRQLEKRKIVLYRNYNKRYILFEGTDLDIQSALIEAESKVEEVSDIAVLLREQFQLPPVMAKKSYYQTGTPRLFEYVISSRAITEVPRGEVDGFINLVFSDKIIQSEVKRVSSQCEDAILYGYYKNTSVVRELLHEIEKTKRVIRENADDRVAVRELSNILQHQQNLLSHAILNNFTTRNSEVVWYYKGNAIHIADRGAFNKLLSEICDDVYTHTPIFSNELVNRHSISSTIHGAKRNFFKALVERWSEPDLGFDPEKFPAEKTIYLTLLKQNDIDPAVFGKGAVIRPSEQRNFHLLWQEGENFLNSAKSTRRKVSDLVQILSARPFKVKGGFLEFWIPAFLFLRRDDFALFGSKGYIPFITDEVLELMVKNPDEYEVKTFAIDGVKLDIFNSYRKFLQQQSKEKVSNAAFIETIKPFLTFYRDLPEYAKSTKRLKSNALAVREAIAQSKDPEQTFFVDFPAALGFPLTKLKASEKEFKQYIESLQSAIRDIRTSFEELVNRVELFIQTEIVGEAVPFEEYKALLQKRYLRLKKHLLLPAQRTFVQRLESGLDDRKAWFNSLVQALLQTTLERLADEQEVLVYDRFKAMIRDLDTLTELSGSDFEEDKEDVVEIQIGTFQGGIQKKIVRLPKNKKPQVKAMQDKIRGLLGSDVGLNLAALSGILNDYLSHD